MPERNMNACVTPCTNARRYGVRRWVCAACLSQGPGKGDYQGETTSACGRGLWGRKRDRGKRLPEGDNLGRRKELWDRKEGPGRTAVRGRQPRLAEGTMAVERKNQGEWLPGGGNLGWRNGPWGLEGETGENGCQGKTTSAGGRDHGGWNEKPGRTAARGGQPRLAEGTMGVGGRYRGK